MPKYKRNKTKYPGVYYINGTSHLTGKQEKIYYIFYRINGKKVEEKVGRQYKNAMTPASASLIRALKIKGELEPNKKKRLELEKDVWNLDRLWLIYKEHKSELRGLRNDEYRYNKYIKDNLGKKEPSEITPLDINQLKNRLQKLLKPQTVKHVLVQIQRIINFSASMQLCSRLSFKIEMPKFDNRKTENLTTEQFKRLLEVLDEEPNIDAANVMKLAMLTGMRKSEILNLQWNDIDFDRGFIFISDPKSIIRQHIPLNNSAYMVFQSIKKHGDSTYIFPGKNGKQRDKTSFNKPFNRIKKKAGLPDDFRPLHGLRHVYASMLASSGQVDMYTLQKLLTHKSPLMTQRYAHLRDETLKRASDLAGDLVNQAINSGQDKKVVNLDDN